MPLAGPGHSVASGPIAVVPSDITGEMGPKHIAVRVQWADEAADARQVVAVMAIVRPVVECDRTQANIFGPRCRSQGVASPGTRTVSPLGTTHDRTETVSPNSSPSSSIFSGRFNLSMKRSPLK